MSYAKIGLEAERRQQIFAKIAPFANIINKLNLIKNFITMWDNEARRYRGIL